MNQLLSYFISKQLLNYGYELTPDTPLIKISKLSSQL